MVFTKYETSATSVSLVFVSYFNFLRPFIVVFFPSTVTKSQKSTSTVEKSDVRHSSSQILCFLFRRTSSASMKIKTAEALFTASTKGWGWGKEKMVLSFFLALRARSRGKTETVKLLKKKGQRLWTGYSHLKPK